MKYLEKYVFDLIPDITQLKDFPQQINDTTIADYFKLSTEERLIIADFHKKEYSFFSKNWNQYIREKSLYSQQW